MKITDNMLSILDQSGALDLNDTKIADLAIQCVDLQCDVIRLKKRVNKLLDALQDARLNRSVFLWRDDLKKEVIV